MRIYVDVDKTIFHTNGMNYESVTPILKNIQIINNLYNSGHTITMWTARGTLSNICFFGLTQQQLIACGVKFHELRMGKPAFDILIDDKALNALWDVESATKMAVDTSKFIIIVQARTGSTRLPNKMLLPIGEEDSLLQTIVKRLLKNKFRIPVVVATTTSVADNSIVSECENLCECFRGSENNVLKRFIDTCTFYQKKFIIRVCGDNPFVSLLHMENMISDFIKKQCSLDYFTYSINNSSCIKSHLGFFTEIVSLKSLRKIPDSVEQHYLENVTEYIYEEKKVENTSFCIEFKDFPICFPETVRLTLDTANDYKIINEIYNKLDMSKTDDIDLYKLHYIILKNSHLLNEMKVNIEGNIK